MYVRVTFGRYAGEIRDIEPVCAKLMLEDGRAKDPRLEPVAAREKTEVALPKTSMKKAKR